MDYERVGLYKFEMEFCEKFDISLKLRIEGQNKLRLVHSGPECFELS